MKRQLLGWTGLFFYAPAVIKYTHWGEHQNPDDSYWGILTGMGLFVTAVALIALGVATAFFLTRDLLIRIENLTNREAK